MKRGKPLKRTPLKRGDSKLQSKKPLNKRSQKMKDKYVERRKIVSEMLKSEKCSACVIFHVYDGYSRMPDNPSIPHEPRFGVCHVRKTQDVHEIVNRSQGGSILDPDNLLAVCRPCHRRITENPIEAQAVGLHLPRWLNTKAGLSEARRIRITLINGKMTQGFWENDQK